MHYNALRRYKFIHILTTLKTNLKFISTCYCFIYLFIMLLLFLKLITLKFIFIRYTNYTGLLLFVDL